MKMVMKQEKWQIIFKQYSNPQAIEYMDIRRVGLYCYPTMYHKSSSLKKGDIWNFM